uniref:T9SS sorting signal type C domain-containing protein n=1 Tax=Flavobacterium sp. TaxID=239 RepID=UPI0040492D76
MKNNYFHKPILVVLCFFAQLVFSQTTTWDGSTWDNSEPTIMTNAIFTGDYSSPVNITAKSITVSNAAIVTFNSSHTLTIENDITVDPGSSLVFENNASLLQINSVATNTGNIIYKRDTTPMIKNQYTYWGSPVSGQILNVFSPLTSTSRYHTFNAAPAVNYWVNESPTNAMVAGKGYAIRAPDNYTTTPQVYNGEFIGTPNNGTIPVSVEAFDPFLKNYNFISNPYPSAIDVVTMFDNTNLGTIYFWTHNSAISANVFTTDDYAVRTRTTSTAAISGGAVPDQYISAGQGFFVSAGTTSTINFTNAMRVSENNTQFYRTTQNVPLNYYIHLNLTNSLGAFKQIAVGYQEDATNGYDFGTDALASTEGVIQFYSIISPLTYGFGIQGRAYPWTLTDQIPLGYTTTVAGDYNIAIDHNNVFFDDKDIFLEDTNNGTFYNLRTSSLTFTAAVGTFNNRFKLHYRDLTLSIEDNLVNDSSLMIYSTNETTKFLSNNINITTVEAFDVTGRLLFEEKNINNLTFEKNISPTNQTIFITVTLENGQKVRRKIIL